MGSRYDTLIIVSVILFIGLSMTSVSGNITFHAIADNHEPTGCGEDDGGINPSVRGKVFIGQRVKSDYCLSEKVLKEWYCDGGLKSVAIECGSLNNGKLLCYQGICGT